MSDRVPADPAGGDGVDRAEPEVDVRVLLANERTLLAWLRTALALVAGGVAVFELGNSTDARLAIGTVLTAVGAAAALVGLRRYRSTDAAVRRGEAPVPSRSLEAMTVALVAVAVLVAAAYLASDTL